MDNGRRGKQKISSLTSSKRKSEAKSSEIEEPPSLVPVLIKKGKEEKYEKDETKRLLSQNDHYQSTGVESTRDELYQKPMKNYMMYPEDNKESSRTEPRDVEPSKITNSTSFMTRPVSESGEEMRNQLSSVTTRLMTLESNLEEKQGQALKAMEDLRSSQIQEKNEIKEEMKEVRDDVNEIKSTVRNLDSKYDEIMSMLKHLTDRSESKPSSSSESKMLDSISSKEDANFVGYNSKSDAVGLSSGSCQDLMSSTTTDEKGKPILQKKKNTLATNLNAVHKVRFAEGEKTITTIEQPSSIPSNPSNGWGSSLYRKLSEYVTWKSQSN